MAVKHELTQQPYLNGLIYTVCFVLFLQCKAGALGVAGSTWQLLQQTPPSEETPLAAWRLGRRDAAVVPRFQGITFGYNGRKTG